MVDIYLGAGIPTSVAYATADRNLIRSLTALSVLPLLLLLLAWGVADRLILRPVDALVLTARRLAGGDLAVRTRLAHRAGELGRLADAFDEMAGRLQTLFEDAHRRLQRLQSLNAIDHAITGQHTLSKTLGVILEQVTAQLEVDAAIVLLLNQEHNLLEFAASSGFASPAVTEIRLPLGDSYSGRVASERRSLVVPDLSTAEGFSHITQPIENEGFVSFCGIPLMSEDRVLGVLSIFHRSSLDFQDEWMGFLEALALQTAIAVDNCQLQEATRRLVEQTRVQASRLRQTVDSMPEGVWLLDEEQRVVLANPLGEKYLAQLANAAIGGRVVRVGGQALERLLEPVQEGTAWHEVGSLSSGQVFELAPQPVKVDRETGGWVLIIRNVTGERQQQEYLQGQDRLATVGQLAAGIAHDFNNIMAVITLYSQALAGNPDHPQREHYLETIRQQALRASNLTNQILDFSRSAVMEPQHLDLLPFVEEMRDLCERTLPARITISIDAEPGSYPVCADPTRLQQVFLNLTVNARDAMPEGGEMNIWLSHFTLAPGSAPPLPEMKPGSFVHLSVADSGTGIPAGVLPHIFEPFFTTKSREQGTGLGLAQVYGIIRQHSGVIGVQSEPGNGTIFTIYLPLAGEPVPGRAETPVTVDLGGSERILLVEDNPFTRAAMKDTMNALGYEVLEAGNGLEALAYLERSEPVDMVISDVDMPVMGGLALQQRLQADYPGLHLLPVTGYSQPQGDRPPGERDGVAWLVKPFTADELDRKIKQLLSARQ